MSVLPGPRIGIFNEYAVLCGLAIDRTGMILVGSVGGATHKYISMHKQDGSHVRSIKVNADPFYLAVTPEGSIVIRSGFSEPTIQIVDQSGNLILKVHAPTSVANWVPRGVLCIRDSILISNYVQSGGIYLYSNRGYYLSCVLDGLKFPSHFDLSDNGKKLAVILGKKVTLYRRDAGQ